MSKFTDVFGAKKVLLPVIHVADAAQAKRNAAIAFGEGAEGIFLISHTPAVDHAVLKRIYEEVRAAYPREWIGLNFLDLEPEESIFYLPPDASGLWEDDLRITESPTSARFAGGLKELQAKKEELTGRPFLYFGGVAFKYTQIITDPGAAARWATPYVDVITTSGEATGSAPNLEKIIEMRDAIGTHPLANASGTTPENIGPFAEYLDAFLVATGISDPGTDELNPAKVRACAKALAA